ncbi:Phosphoglycolate phosphatase [uncultured archaeon]|nr:Phosphoglycolate phosphatase [uncultured archaeon]
MYKFKIDNIIFDLDGTLIDSAGDIIHCLKKAYFSIPEYSNVEISSAFIGPPLNELIKKITPDITEEQTQIVTKEFRNCYDNSSFSKTILNDGVYKLIQDLKHLNIKIFIATNKPILVTKKILTNLKIDVFDDVVSLDALAGKKMNKTEMISYIIKKWNLHMDTTLMVGDDASDIIAAHNNDMSAVAILDGYGNANTINEAKPLYVLNSINDFNNLLTKYKRNIQ